MKIRILGRNLPTADDGMNIPTCPPNSYWDSMLGKCVTIPQLNPSNKPISSIPEQEPQLSLPNKLKNQVEAWMGDTESSRSKAASLLDPTGVSNYPFLNKAFDDFYDNPGVLTGLTLGMETLGSIPLFGIGERTAEAVVRPAWKTLTSSQKAARVIKAPFRTAEKVVLNPAEKLMSAPARGVNKAYKAAGISSPILRNPYATFNRGVRGWELMEPLWYPPLEKGVETGASIYDRFTHPEDYEPTQKSMGGEEDGCPTGKCKDPITATCVPCLAAPKPPTDINAFSSWSNDTSINQTPPPLPQQTKVDPYGNVTTTGGVDIGNPRQYIQDPNQTANTNLYNIKGKCQPGYQKDKLGNCVPVNKSKASGRNLGAYLDMLYNTTAAVSDFFNTKKEQKDWNTQFRQMILPDNRYVPAMASKEGDGRDINTGAWVNAGYKTQNFGQFGGSMLKDSDMGKIKIRITGTPNKMAYGGQLGYGFDLGQRNTYAAMPKGKIQTVSDQMPEVPREHANIEAEKGETVYADVDGDGVEEHMNIGGKRHVDGGTPLNVPEGSFVFSDTAKMKIKDEEILAKFGLSPKKGGYTPAEIAKRYDINKYKAIVEDPNSDSIDKNTAVIMIKSYQKKLAELALIQEQMKGFPQGIPEMCKGVIPDEILNGIEEQLAQREPKDITDPSQREVTGKVQQMAQESGVDVPTASELGMQDEPETAPQEEVPEESYEFGGDLHYFEEDDVPESAYGGPIVMQTAGQVPPKGQVTWLSPELQNAITTINQQTGQRVVVSPRVTAGDIYIPPTQHKQKTGLFGDVTPQEIDEFKQRHDWYFKDHPNWSYANPSDVLDFQTQYDDQFAKKHGFQYFVGNQKFNKKDSKFGEYTYNAPGLETSTPPADTSTPDYTMGYKCTGRDAADKPQIQSSSYKDVAARDADGAYASPEEAARNQCPPKLKTAPGAMGPGKTSKTPFGYMTPDLVGIGVALGSRVRKYLPYIAETAYEPGRYIPEDWKAKASQLKSLSEQMGKQMADYMPGQNLQASLSNLYGQNAESLIGAIADVDARNVRGVNAFNQAEMERKDKFNLLRAANATERWKGNVIANQQYDNALNKKAELIYDRYQNAWNNRMNLGLVNATNKFYFTDPSTGRTIFRAGYGPESLGKTGSGVADWSSVGEDYTKAMTALPGLTPADYLRAIGKIQSSSSATTSKYGGMPRGKKKDTKALANALFSGYTLPF